MRQGILGNTRGFPNPRRYWALQCPKCDKHEVVLFPYWTGDYYRVDCRSCKTDYKLRLTVVKNDKKIT